MSKKQKDFDPKRNQRFAVALNVLRQHSENQELSQKDLASKMGMNENSISRILTLQNKVTDNFISKFQTASGCIFNLQWLRGESDVMLAADADKAPVAADNPHESTHIDQGSLMNATIAAQQTSIESLKRELAAKDTLIETLREQVSDLRAAIEQNKKDNFGNYPFTPGVADEGRKAQI